MYLVTIDNNILHDPRIKDYQILNPVLNLEINKTNSFNFTIYPNNPMFNSIERLKSIIEVYDDGELIFRGRPLNDTANFNKATTIQCEGELAYLNDSIMHPYSYFGTVEGLLELYINNHNTQVDVTKQFTLGTVNVAGDFVRSNIEYTNTWEELSTKTFGSSMGGYLRLRRENDINYIDYLTDSSYISGQTIELSKNLLDYEKTVNASDIVTVLIPLGAKLLDEEGNETDERLTIESVNAGSKFIEHPSGISKYGRIVGYKIWDDINSASLLKTRATSDLNFLVNLGISLKIKAVDLNILDNSIPKIRFFEYVKIISEPHEIDDTMLIKKQTIHLDDPSQNTIEVGVEVSSFTDKQLEANNTIKKINSDYVTNEKVSNVSQNLTEQISLINQKADGIELSVLEVESKVDSANLASILVNANGELDNYANWEFYNTNAILIPYIGLQARLGMTQFTNFGIVNNDNSLSGTNISFFGNGKAMNGLFRVLPEHQYSYRAKRFSGSQTFTIEIHEFSSNKTFIKKTDYIIDNDPEITLMDLNANTRFIGITYVVTGVSVANQLEIGEVMFGIGPPKNYARSVDDVRLWAESQFNITANDIQLIQSDINNTTVKITGLNGVEIWNDNGKGLTVYDDNNMPSIELSSSGNLIARDATISGTILATAGEIGGYDIEQDELVGNDIHLGSSQIQIGDVVLKRADSEAVSLGVYGAGLDILPSGATLPHVRLGGDNFATKLPTSGVLLWNIARIQTATGVNSFIGSDIGRFDTIYLQNQPNVSSDTRIKHAIQEIPKDLIKVLYDIKPKMYLQGKEWHFGYIAQDVERALYRWATSKYGLEAKYYVDKFALLHKSESMLSLLYGELVVLKEQYMLDKIDKLEKDLQEIKELLKERND